MATKSAPPAVPPIALAVLRSLAAALVAATAAPCLAASAPSGEGAAAEPRAAAVFPLAGIREPETAADLDDPRRRFAYALGARSAAAESLEGPPGADLHGGRFRVEVDWQDHQGGSGPGHAVPLSDQSAYFWFFRPSNVELVVKVLDGRGVNGRFWVFYGALSDVPYRVRVTDSWTGAVRVYENPPRHMASFADTAAFGDDPAAPAPPVPAHSPAPAPVPVTTFTAPAGTTCTQSSTELCLGGGRFRITAAWRDPRGGGVGAGRTVPLTGDTGSFWFFAPGNAELVVKVLDGVGVNGHFWVFYGALTDVAFDLTVVDTASGEGRIYRNPAHRMASRGDAAAFRPGPEHPGAFAARLEEVRQEAARMSADDFAAHYAPAPRVEELSYDPLAAQHLPAIVEALDLSPDQLAALAENGFVVVPGDWWVPELMYSEAFRADLPVLVTADSLLYVLHRSYDAILETLERDVLVGELDVLLASLHGELAARGGALPGGFGAAADEVDVYLAVARTLLAGAPVAPVRAGSAERVAPILAAAASLQPAPVELFGVKASWDFSQLVPRGHYKGDPVLERYFRAMMWIGRTELRLVYYDPGLGTDVFNRRAVDGAVLLHELLGSVEGARGRWERINLVVEEMVGERDSMDPRDVDRFRAEAGLGSLAEAAARGDAALHEALAAGDYGLQRIQSQILTDRETRGGTTRPRAFLLLGQRFVPDSYVFHRLTYARVRDHATGLSIPRMLPDPLDVAFALGSNPAAELLLPEVRARGLQGELHETRFLLESHPAEFWGANLYNGWLAALAALNGVEHRPSWPEAMRTRAWDLKTLNTQLASWAELRRDTILYAKQSYSDGVVCSYPDAYVEPVPRFFAALAALADRGLGMAETLAAASFDVEAVRLYFDHLGVVARTLERIAGKEVAGEPLTAEERSFLRRAIEKEEWGCGFVSLDGWYATLFFDSEAVTDFAPTVADVHTAPTDELGTEVGWVLHAATGAADWIVFTLDDCEGPRAFVGPVSSFHSLVTEGYDRLDDDRWLERLYEGETARPGWASGFRAP